jgi:CheY-like chemotaxis protein
VAENLCPASAAGLRERRETMDPTVNLHRLRIMIVEDNPRMMLIIKALLRGFGITEFIEAKSEPQAWEKLQDHTVDIIVLDRMLAEGDGLSFTRRVRTSEDSTCPYIPIIMLSAHSERSRVAEARDAGVTEFCRKPVTAKDLLAKISSVVDRPRAFVRTRQFFGPDRRRHDSASYEGDERRDILGRIRGAA